MSFIAKFGGKSVEGQIVLHMAAKNGDTFLLQQLLSNGASVHIKCTRGFTALHYAVESQHVRNVDILLKKGASIYERNKEGQTPLDLAFEKYADPVCDMRIKSKLLIHLLNYTLLDEDKNSACLFLAVRNNDEELLKFLLRNNKSLKINSVFENHRSLLHVATVLGHTKIVKLLIQNGADIHAKTLNGETPLHLASAAGHFEVVKQLLGHGVRVEFPDNNGNIPLHYAIMNNQRHIVSLLNNLPKMRIDGIDQERNANLSLLHYAVLRNDGEFFDMALAKENVDLNSRTKDGETPLHFGIIYNRLKLIYELVKLGAKVNVKSSNGETPLHLAAALGQSHSVGFLLKAGADVDCITSSGSTPLHYVLDRDTCNDIIGGYNRSFSLLDELKTRYAIVKTLLEKNASVNVHDHSGKSPLHYALSLNATSASSIVYKQDIIKLLVNYGAELNSTCENDLTPIFHGFHTLDENILRWLIWKGADVKRKSGNSESLLSRAIKLKSANMVEVLLEAGVDVDSCNLSEVLFNYESDESNKFEIFKMLANRSTDAKALINKIKYLSCADLPLTEEEKEDLLNSLIGIIVRRKHTGELLVHEEDLESDDILKVDLQSRFRKWESQVSRMKRTRVDKQGLTLYDIFTSSIDNLESYATNQQLMTFLQSNKFAENFPNCTNLLQSRMKKARYRQILVDPSTESLFNLVHKGYKIKLPRSVTRRIARYLKITDLKNLIQSTVASNR